jgi:hypothetical protein
LEGLSHSSVAPPVHALLSMHFFRRRPAASPLRGFAGIDLVREMVERSPDRPSSASDAVARR